MKLYKEILIGVASFAICFSIGRGAQWLKNHDWHEDDSELTLEEVAEQITELERSVKSIEKRLKRIENLDIEEEIEEINTKLNRIGSSKKFKHPDEDEEEITGMAGKTCHSQRDCGGKNSGYFCNYGGNHTKNICEKTKAATYKMDGVTYYYNKLSDLRSWCREATESYQDRQSPGNCNWGYLSYSAANAWCESIGKKLLDPYVIEENCEDFDFLPKATEDQQYWTTGMRVVHTGNDCSIQNMVRGDGYCYAGGVICQ